MRRKGNVKQNQNKVPFYIYLDGYGKKKKRKK